jgi:hypothetical protein
MHLITDATHQTLEDLMFRYRIRLEDLSKPKDPNPFAFEASNHDDLIKIVQRAQQGGIIEGDEAASVIVGLKLLMEVVLKHRKDPLFAPLEEPLANFIRALKKGKASELAEGGV